MCVCVEWIVGGGGDGGWNSTAGHSGLIIINHLSGHMFIAGASVIPFGKAKAVGPA